MVTQLRALQPLDRPWFCELVNIIWLLGGPGFDESDLQSQLRSDGWVELAAYSQFSVCLFARLFFNLNRFLDW